MQLTALSAVQDLETVLELLTNVLDEDFAKTVDSVFYSYVGMNATAQQPPLSQ